MKKSFFIILFFLGFISFSQFNPIQRENSYQVHLDLTAIEEDKLPVEIVTPLLNKDSVEFHIPRIIPGTYDVHNYGRFVNDLVALSGMGDTLKIRKIDINRWMIYNARDLYKISYGMDDTYDYPDEIDIFEPAGTSVEDSVFLLNNFGFVGYLDGHQEQPFELTITKPKGFYGSTALIGEMGEEKDVFKIEDYFTLHDSPLLYCVPDTASQMVGNTRVLVSVYSPNGVVNAKESLAEISAVLDAAYQYLGGNLPVEKYAVLIYTVPMNQMGASYGALEHHRSTVLYMPEMEGDRFYGSVRDITSHEFFHIITPLRIHSQMVADFDFIDPEMSSHIWLYEGVTEYNSHLVQIRSGIYTLAEFIGLTKDKMQAADKYDENIPLTLASEHTLTFLKDQYQDFYQKGHLAGMALDLKLIELSNGEYRLIDLLDELGRTYGADTFFVDDDLFDIITEKTYPEIREFMARHYEGTEPFPFAELLGNVGIQYIPEAEVERFTVGNIEFGYNFSTGRIKVASVAEMDEFGRDLGWKEGDEIIEFNGEPVDLSTISDVISNFYKTTEPGDKVKVLVARPEGDSEYDEEKLKAKARTAMYTEKNIIRLMDEPTDEQLRLRKVWINQ
ncbi:MAG: PDZ domain-containing protein [Owenweeksia sp.]|nr:PDZ domain-containing protein [Owenweeksia sp.]